MANLRGNLVNLAAPETIQRETGNDRMPAEAMLKAWPRGGEDHDPVVARRIQAHFDQFERRWIDPVHVLDHPQNRLLQRKSSQLPDQGCERLAALSRRRQIELCIASLRLQPQHCCHKGNRIRVFTSHGGQQGFELVQRLVVAVIAGDRGSLT